MRVRCPPRDERIYSSNVYLLLGEWSTIDDVNTLVDVGADPALLAFIDGEPTGVGKKKVDLVLLTHRHYDHELMLPAVKQAYAPTVAAWGPAGGGVDLSLADGQRLRAGDGVIEVIHTPAHTDDSVCFYSPSDRALFAGDTPVLVQTDDQLYGEAFLEAMSRIAARPVDVVYFGHGEPLTDRCNERLSRTIEHLRRARALATR